MVPSTELIISISEYHRVEMKWGREPWPPPRVWTRLGVYSSRRHGWGFSPAPPPTGPPACVSARELTGGVPGPVGLLFMTSVIPQCP